MHEASCTAPVRLHFTDFWEDFTAGDNLFLSILKARYPVVLDKDAPDFLFHSCFGSEHLAYSCVKICFLGENLSPDFNLSDYACGFDHLEFEDRYLRYPLYRLYMRAGDLTVNDAAFFARESRRKGKFCNFLYSNARNASPEREAFFHLLSRYKPVDSGGSLLNNIGRRVGDKLAWQRDYKFSIAFENSSKNGYTTEKLLQALQAHTIPIYWGNPRVADDFNPERFINCHAYGSLDEVVRAVKELDENPEAYAAMLEKPWVTTPVTALPQDDPVFADFLYNIIDQGPVRARRVTRNGCSLQYHLHQQTSRFMAAPVVKLYLKWQGMARQVQGLLRR